MDCILQQQLNIKGCMILTHPPFHPFSINTTPSHPPFLQTISSIFPLSLSLSSIEPLTRNVFTSPEMEQTSAPVLAKKVWNLVRILYLVIRKGIFKRKWMVDLNRMMKRGKIAGKALQSLMQFHHHNWPATEGGRLSFSTPPPGEYEFSCSSSPSTTYPNFSLFSQLNKKHRYYSPANSTRQTTEDHLDLMAINAAVLRAMEMTHSETASPALPGFGRTPMVRQLRVTDSPFPLSGVDEDNRVDEAAEQFISRFYDDLRRQNTRASRVN